MLKHSIKPIFFIFFIALISTCQFFKKPLPIIVTPEASETEMLAAKELRKYLYLRTNELLPHSTTNLEAIAADAFIITSKNKILSANWLTDSLRTAIQNLGEQAYLITTIRPSKHKQLLICGGSPVGALYGTYRFLETLGIRFYLHTDVIPDAKIELTIPEVNLEAKPIFSHRGIHPFHDFPEGPDWWNRDDYEAIIAQLPKMGMNFLGFHTYPEQKFGGWAKAEPMVWIGLKADIQNDGTVKSAYPVLHSHTQDSTWGYFAKKTSEFHFGAAQLFETDNFGADYMKTVSLWPHSPAENIRIFNEFGALFNDAFTLANRQGVKTCIGTETPLSIPENVKNQLRAQGIDPATDRAKRLVYEGIFTRIMKQHPLDYYWFWTPEFWTWQDVKPEQVQQIENDLRQAVTAQQNVEAPFTLATCGWVLGPPADRTQFDRFLPREMPFSCINREVGFSPVEPDFGRIQNRPKWQISWVEDDPALISPQLWVGRIRKDALDAFNYGCTGLMGIHWRTQILAPNFSALARAGWELGDWQHQAHENSRDLSCDDFYQDWARTSFGNEAAPEIAALFTRLDGGPLYIRGQNERMANLPRTSDWAGTGPGGVKINPRPWEAVKADFAFVDEFVALANRIKGKGNQDRFDYWLNTFRYTRAMAEVGCLLGEWEQVIKEINATNDLLVQREQVRTKLLPLRKQAAEKWGEMVTYLIMTVGTTGELGTIANLEMHNLGQLQRLNLHDSLLTAVLGESLPELAFWKDYRGPSRLIVPTKRTLLEPGENLSLKVIILTNQPIESANLLWRPLSKGAFEKIPLQHLARSVNTVSLAADQINGNDFEYYIEVQLNQERLVFPATAPAVNQAITVW